MDRPENFVWETHGIHAGTFVGPIKHGIDDLEAAVARAVDLGHPAICFIIHTPRLTTYRYKAEANLNRKFIRGDSAFATYVPIMRTLREAWEGRIEVRFGIELEWQGLGLGLTWSRAKLEQVLGVDFVVGSVHFGDERIGYDDSLEEAQRLVELRGGAEAYWEAYLDEVLTMLDHWGPFIHVVGHLDLPKLYVPAPDCFGQLESSTEGAAVKMRIILHRLKDLGIALDLNLSGEAKGCGAYPGQAILRLARRLGVPLAIGTDTHRVEDIGKLYDFGLERARALGFTSYLSFVKGAPQVHLTKGSLEGKRAFEAILNPGLAILSRLTQEETRKMAFHDVAIAVGQGFAPWARAFENALVLGEGRRIELRKNGHSICLKAEAPRAGEAFRGIYFKHRDKPGILALLVSVLASEGINIKTAYLYNLGDGQGEAYITVGADDQDRVRDACEFALGTNPEDFLELDPNYDGFLPRPGASPLWIHSMDDLVFDLAPGPQMVYSVHEDRPGLLFLLLAALAARRINVRDLRLTERSGHGRALLVVHGETKAIKQALESVRKEFILLRYLDFEAGQEGD